MSGNSSRHNIAVLARTECSGCTMFEHQSQINIRSDGQVWHRSVFNNDHRLPKWDRITRLFMPLEATQEDKGKLVHEAIVKAETQGYTLEEVNYSMIFARRIHNV